MKNDLMQHVALINGGSKVAVETNMPPFLFIHKNESIYAIEHLIEKEETI